MSGGSGGCGSGRHARAITHAELIVAKVEDDRRRRGIGIAELSRRVGIDQKRLWYVLRAGRPMRAEELMRLYYVFEMDMRQLLPGGMAGWPLRFR